MKVENVKFGINNPTKLPARQAHKPNFTGGSVPQAAANSINMHEEIKAFMPPIIKGMKKVCDNMGEVQNIIINALGTGLVAPIFIKWNPLSKTDEDTRTYSAWRQPVSAVLAVVTQVGVTIPFNKMIDRLANNGYYDENYNKTLFQDKSYIEKIVKRQYPYASKAEITRLTKQKMTDQQNNLLRMIKEDKIVMNKDNGQTFQISEKTYRALQEDVLSKKLQEAQAELDKCNQITIPKKVERAEYYINNKQEALGIFEKLDKQLDASNAPKEIKAQIRKLKTEHKNKNPELIKIFDEILDRRGNNTKDLKIAMQAKVKGILRDINFYTETKSPLNSKEKITEFVKAWETKERINPITSEINVLKKMQEMLSDKKRMTDIENYLNTVIENDKGHRLAKFKYSEEISKLLQTRIKNNLKAHKQLTGLRVSLIILPLSCWLLNWTYPKFMDAVFPNLSNKKHPNEIKNLVNKANEQAEVKS